MVKVMGAACSDATLRGGFGLAKSVPTWVLCPSLLGGAVWMKIGDGLRVLGVNGERTAAVDVHVDCEWEGSVSAALAAEAVAPFFEPLKSIGPVMDVKVTDKLALLVPLDRRRIELLLPVDFEEAPSMRLPKPKFEGSAFGVFDETVNLLKRLRGSDSVRVRVRVEGGKMVVEPPRRVLLLRKELEAGSKEQSVGSGFEPVEVRVLFRDIRKVLEVFKAANLTPVKLWFTEHILGVEAEYGKARVRGLIAGQID